jgi:hypothetical protein
MRGIVVLGIGLVIAFWVDHRYYDGRYSRETGEFRRDSEIPFDLGRIDSSTANRSAIVTNNRVTDSATNWPYGV